MKHLVRAGCAVMTGFAALLLLAGSSFAQRDCILLQNCDVIITPHQPAVSQYGSVAVGTFHQMLKVYGNRPASGFSWNMDSQQEAETLAADSCAQSRLYNSYTADGCRAVWDFPNAAALIIYVANGIYQWRVNGAYDPWTAIVSLQNAIQPQRGTRVTVHWVRNSGAPQSQGWPVNQNYGWYEYVQR